ncbi:MAG: class I SAM-dependent methyltransferase [Candidatus Magnetoovum sp. WYHC-5]|nr:class I SAM-dependent methyltransferase [Candidatus Magnetoovum sp. WYHC-5]
MKDKYAVEIKKWDSKCTALSQQLKNKKIDKTYEDVFSFRNNLKPVYEFFNLKEHEEVVLDYGCGAGWATVFLAQKAKTVYAVDISVESIKILEHLVEANSIKNIKTCVCNGELLSFEDNFFDFVFGNAIIHHIELEKSLLEVSRVLKKGGKAAFCEPYAHNLFINLYRYIKHNYIEEFKGTDRPIKNEDKGVFEKYFSKVDFVPTSLLSDRIEPLLAFDAVMIKTFPFLRKYAGYVTILLEK